MSRVRIKCFLVEKTDKEYREPCSRPDCKEKDCYNWRAPMYRRTDTGEEAPLSKMPAGAMWFADWYNEPRLKGPDGKTLVVCVPDASGTHHWIVDGRASNCTKKDDDVHKCWCRHGDAPNITVDKVGKTCSAGAGSIVTDGWHGFLRNGYLESC